MLQAIRSTWALFLGIALIMLCNGLQGTLLGVRAGIEGFSTGVTGAIMTAYFIGIVAGSQIVPVFIGSVGHIRVFAALASLASSSVLLHSIFVDPWAWGLMRFITGLSYAGLYIVIESWINERATNQTRGQLLAIYMIVTMGGYAGGQLLLNTGSPESFELFLFASVLVSIALVPISLTSIQAPTFEIHKTLSIRQLYKASPLGIVGAIGTGFGTGTLLGMGAVFGVSLGLAVADITSLIIASQVGALLMLWPVGRLSDRFDRRIILTIVTLCLGTVTLIGVLLGVAAGWPLLLIMALMGGLNLPMYALCIAHTNDHLDHSQMIAASSSLVLANSLGASMGPLFSAQIMDFVGPMGYLISIGLAHTLIGVFALYRMTRRAAPEEQGQFVPVDAQAASVVVALAAEQQIEMEQQDSD